MYIFTVYHFVGTPTYACMALNNVGQIFTNLQILLGIHNLSPTLIILLLCVDMDSVVFAYKNKMVAIEEAILYCVRMNMHKHTFVCS